MHTERNERVGRGPERAGGMCYCYRPSGFLPAKAEASTLARRATNSANDSMETRKRASATVPAREGISASEKQDPNAGEERDMGEKTSKPSMREVFGPDGFL